MAPAPALSFQDWSFPFISYIENVIVTPGYDLDPKAQVEFRAAIEALLNTLDFADFLWTKAEKTNASLKIGETGDSLKDFCVDALLGPLVTGLHKAANWVGVNRYDNMRLSDLMNMMQAIVSGSEMESSKDLQAELDQAFADVIKAPPAKNDKQVLYYIKKFNDQRQKLYTIGVQNKRIAYRFERLFKAADKKVGKETVFKSSSGTFTSEGPGGTMLSVEEVKLFLSILAQQIQDMETKAKAVFDDLNTKTSEVNNIAKAYGSPK